MISFLYCFRWLTTNKPQPNLNQQETPLFKGNLLRSSLGPGSALGEKGEKKIAVGEIKNRLAKRADR